MRNKYIVQLTEEERKYPRKLTSASSAPRLAPQWEGY
jgi:hypothetical protein